MRQLRPVIWAKGTFLTPQHLQTQDRFIESTFQFRLEALNFRPWGFADLRIRHEALSEGNFAISRAVGIFPDGLPFEIPGSDAAPAPKPLAQFFDADQQSIDVYLAIPSEREKGLNVSVTKQNVDTRYSAEVVDVRDENTGANEKPVQFARKNFRFLLEGESREGSMALRIARVRRTAGALELDTTFVPPLLNIAASDYLVSILRRLVEILAAKSSILSGKRRQKSQNLADFTSADIANFWLLYTVNSHFPVLRHIYETRKGHPDTAFRILTSLAGALTTFSMKFQPRDLPSYDHDELSSCFTELDEKLRELLETVVPSNYISLPLKLVQQSIYATTIDDDKYLVGTKMYLAVNADMPEADVIKRVPQLIKVCSASQVEHLVRAALPGLQMTYLPRPPGAIPVKLAFQYFALNQAGPAWEAIGKARNLAAYVPGDISKPQLELIILLPQAI
ncbi:MAG TPA: type VI secretion system baseplate subunit TssK [Candidatus Acidoferrales bacterium]|nr:type VI secretion system baseplate subunit TssK [Candidatus Acidoferrales bacterium]